MCLIISGKNNCAKIIFRKNKHETYSHKNQGTVVSKETNFNKNIRNKFLNKKRHTINLNLKLITD